MILNNETIEKIKAKYPTYNSVQYSGANETGVYFRLAQMERGEMVRGVWVVLDEQFNEVSRRPLTFARCEDGKTVQQITLSA